MPLQNYVFVDFKFSACKTENELRQIAAKTVKPDARLKDPEKIAANIEEKTKAAVEKLLKNPLYTQLQKIYLLKLDQKTPLVAEIFNDPNNNDEIIIDKFADWVVKNPDKKLALFCLPDVITTLWQHKIKNCPGWKNFDRVILPALCNGLNLSALFEPGRVFGVKNPETIAEFLQGREEPTGEDADYFDKFVWLADAAKKIIAAVESVSPAVWQNFSSALSRHHIGQFSSGS